MVNFGITIRAVPLNRIIVPFNNKSLYTLLNKTLFKNLIELLFGFIEIVVSITTFKKLNGKVINLVLYITPSFKCPTELAITFSNRESKDTLCYDITLVPPGNLLSFLEQT